MSRKSGSPKSGPVDRKSVHKRSEGAGALLAAVSLLGVSLGVSAASPINGLDPAGSPANVEVPGAGNPQEQGGQAGKLRTSEARGAVSVQSNQYKETPLFQNNSARNLQSNQLKIAPSTNIQSNQWKFRSDQQKFNGDWFNPQAQPKAPGKR
jgi:hypothetical protein